MSPKILNGALKTASFNIVFQVFLRCITFFLNAFVLRHVSQAVVGVMNVRLLLLESTVLFLSREAFRLAALSQTESPCWPQIINLVWLTVPLSVINSVVFSFIWLYVLSVPSPEITPHYSMGVLAVSVSCVIEMVAEPLYITSQVYLLTKFTIVLNSVMVLIRTFIFASWIFINSQQAILAFSVAQIVANLFYCLGFYVTFHIYIIKHNEFKNTEILKTLGKRSNQNLNNESSEINAKESEIKEILTDEEDEAHNRRLLNPVLISSVDPQNFANFIPNRLEAKRDSLVGFDETFPFKSLADFFPHTVENKTWIQPNSAQLAWSFLKQGILKQVLTEGERYTMTLFSVMTFKEQGIYDVVNNLGSLAARFLFRPVEDALYFYFAQSIKRDVKIKDQNKERMEEASLVLHEVLNCMVSLGLVIFTFGQSYSTLLLYLYGGDAIASGQGPQLLRTHSFSVLLLAINGVTECYAFSTMTVHQLNKYNYIMAAFSFFFLIITLGLTKLFGGIGFILANCCNMSARIIHSIIFIKSRYADTQFRPLLGLVPNKYFLFSLFITFLVTKLSETHCSNITHFCVGSGCFTFVMIVWGFNKLDLILLPFNKWKVLKSKKE